MAIFETFSKRRNRALKCGKVDPYTYDQVPNPLRIQIVHILKNIFMPYRESGQWSDASPSNKYWIHIHDTLCREKGVFSLEEGSEYSNPQENVFSHILACSIDDFLDTVDLCFLIVSNLKDIAEDHKKRAFGITGSLSEAIEELNYRFREHNVGYQFVGRELVRVDSQVLHAEAVVPALTLLNRPGFEGAENEFQAAHKHYRAGEHRDAILDAGNAFESTLKAICDKRGWTYSKGARASDLLKVVRQNGLYPDYLDKSFEQLLAVLASGLPTVRNEEGGHGQGSQIRETPAHVAAFALHLAATKILFLAECEQTLT